MHQPRGIVTDATQADVHPEVTLWFHVSQEERWKCTYEDRPLRP